MRHYLFFRRLPGLLVLLLLFFGGVLRAQSLSGGRHTPALSLKSNLAYDATGGFNLGAEFKVAHGLPLTSPLFGTRWSSVRAGNGSISLCSRSSATGHASLSTGISWVSTRTTPSTMRAVSAAGG